MQFYADCFWKAKAEKVSSKVSRLLFLAGIFRKVILKINLS